MDKAFDQINIQNDDLMLGKQDNILHSMEVDESYEFKELNNLLSKLQDQTGVNSKGCEVELQSVKVSMESAKVSLTMDPFIWFYLVFYYPTIHSCSRRIWRAPKMLDFFLSNWHG